MCISSLRLPFCRNKWQGWQWACIHTHCHHFGMHKSPNRNCFGLLFAVGEDLVSLISTASGGACFLKNESLGLVEKKISWFGQETKPTKIFILALSQSTQIVQSSEQLKGLKLATDGGFWGAKHLSSFSHENTRLQALLFDSFLPTLLEMVTLLWKRHNLVIHASDHLY